MLNDSVITALEAKGFNRWTKGNFDRLYINATSLGLELDYYKSGNIYGAWWKDERISNSRGYAFKAAKTYIDIATGKLFSTMDVLKEAAQSLYDEALAEI